jgi:hypothetical protein
MQRLIEQEMRDRFAVAAITGILASGSVRAARDYAKKAYAIADAMIEVRNADTPAE